MNDRLVAISILLAKHEIQKRSVGRESTENKKGYKDQLEFNTFEQEGKVRQQIQKGLRGLFSRRMVHILFLLRLVADESRSRKEVVE